MTDKRLPTAAVFRDDEFYLSTPIQLSADPDSEEELVLRRQVKARIENAETKEVWQCSICGYISSKVREVADCCDADALQYIVVDQEELLESVEKKNAEKGGKD